MGLLEDLAGWLKGPGTGFSNVDDWQAPASAAVTPAGATADPNTWPDDWWPNPSNAETWPDDWWPETSAPAPGGFGPGASGPLSGFAPPSGGYGYGPGAGGALGGFDPTGGRSGPTQDELAAMMAGLQQEYSWYDPRGWGRDTSNMDMIGDFFSEGGTGRNILSGVEDGARWLADPSYQAIQELLEGDLSGAIGDFAGGTANQLAPAAGYLGQEGLDVLGNLGDNIYNNWGLRSGLNQLGGDITGALSQVGDWGQSGINQFVDDVTGIPGQVGNLSRSGWRMGSGWARSVGGLAGLSEGAGRECRQVGWQPAPKPWQRGRGSLHRAGSPVGAAAGL